MEQSSDFKMILIMEVSPAKRELDRIDLPDQVGYHIPFVIWSVPWRPDSEVSKHIPPSATWT